MDGRHDHPGEPRNHSWLILLLTALTATGLLLAEFFVERQSAEAHVVKQRNQVRENLMLLQSRLEGNLRANTMLVRGLVSVIAANPGLDQTDFERAARPLFGGQSQLRNIAGAPDMVIRFMFPLAGNEKAIGLDYRKTPTQRAAAEHARATGEIVIAGPVNLAQGGIGLIGRFPVFADVGPNETRFWGLVSAVIDVERLYRDSGLRDANLPIEVAIRGRDAQGETGEIFFGAAELFSGDSERLSILLPTGSWQIAARPLGGWSHELPGRLSIRLSFMLGALLILGPMLLLAWLERRRYQAEIRLRQTLHDLEAARFAAEAGSRAKSEFLAAVGHEIRTPMHGVLGMADLLLTTPLDDEQKSFVQSLKKSARALLDVINQILDYSQLDAGRLKLASVDFAPAELVESVCAGLRPEAEEKGLQLLCATHDGTTELPASLQGDAAHIRQVLRILVGNAIKFTVTGQVAVSAHWRAAEGLRIEVTDTGPGIAPEAQDTLFEPFTQADGTTTRRHGGAGLGLAKAQRLVEALGGTIGVRNAPRQGACFWFELPLKVGAGRTASLADLAPDSTAGSEYDNLPVLDNGALRNLMAATGMSVSELLAMMRDELVQNMAGLAAACAARNGADVQRQAHGIKSTCQQLGALRLAALMRSLETIDCADCAGECSSLLARCQASLDELLAEIKARSA